jgi:signal transduction histidine kinase
VALEYARTQREIQRLAILEDRERIAKELHDGVIQALFAVGMGLQGTAVLSKDPELEERIEGAVVELDRVIRDLRNYIFGLRPGILADRQLDQALRHLAHDFEEKSGLCAVSNVGAAPVLVAGARTSAAGS